MSSPMGATGPRRTRRATATPPPCVTTTTAPVPPWSLAVPAPGTDRFTPSSTPAAPTFIPIARRGRRPLRTGRWFPARSRPPSASSATRGPPPPATSPSSRPRRSPVHFGPGSHTDSNQVVTTCTQTVNTAQRCGGLYLRVRVPVYRWQQDDIHVHAAERDQLRDGAFDSALFPRRQHASHRPRELQITTVCKKSIDQADAHEGSELHSRPGSKQHEQLPGGDLQRAKHRVSNAVVTPAQCAADAAANGGLTADGTSTISLLARSRRPGCGRQCSRAELSRRLRVATNTPAPRARSINRLPVPVPASACPAGVGPPARWWRGRPT